MGAGCYYTMKEIPEQRAYWLDVGYSDEDDECNYYDDDLINLADCLAELPLFHSGRYGKNNQYIVTLKPTYYGDGIIIDVELSDYATALDRHNIYKVYLRIIKHINTSYPLSIATSGYTHSVMPVKSIK